MSITATFAERRAYLREVLFSRVARRGARVHLSPVGESLYVSNSGDESAYGLSVTISGVAEAERDALTGTEKATHVEPVFLDPGETLIMPWRTGEVSAATFDLSYLVVVGTETFERKRRYEVRDDQTVSAGRA